MKKWNNCSVNLNKSIVRELKSKFLYQKWQEKSLFRIISMSKTATLKNINIQSLKFFFEIEKNEWEFVSCRS